MTVVTSFRESLRGAAMTLLRDYAADYGIDLQTYPGRPRSITPPCAFVDRIRETITYLGPVSFQRTPVVDVVVLHGLFDSAQAVAQADRFVDSFLSWVIPRFHAAGDNTLVAITNIEDDPSYVPDWQPENVQRTYFATTFSLEGFAGE
jgi:hypothetical protein